MGNLCSISISIENSISRCWDCISRHSNYFIGLEKNLITLGAELIKLKEKRDDVTIKVVLAEQNHLKRTNQVQGWFSRVDVLISEAENLLINGPQEIQKLCLGGCFSKNFSSSHKYAKKVTEKLGEIADYLNNPDFEAVADEVPAASVDLRPSVPTVGLESTLDKVWRNLEDEDVGMIGIYGMGGVGKTTLLNQINNKFKSLPSGFDVVIWVTVSKNHRLEKVQEDIGEALGFSGHKGVDKKARDILRGLSTKKFVLLLDDIWERVDLATIGIPLPSRENGCKIVLTTRSLEVCGKMEIKKKIMVDCLDAEKAWELFEEKVGEEALDSHHCIRELAQHVAAECGGLPLALITIGRAMSCRKTPEEWEHAIDILRKPATNPHPSMGSEVYPRLRFSYDSLANDLTRKCFLYCRMFPEDCVMQKTDLIDLWIGEGFLDNEPRNKGFDVLGSLMYACLLEQSSNFPSCVKMHDVLRDMAFWISSDHEDEKSMVETGLGLWVVPELRKWESVKRVSLMKNQITNLTEVATTCPDLRTLLLRENGLSRINDVFFQFMRALAVLDMSANSTLKDFPMGIVHLASLQYLNLSWTRISKLPAELKRLVMLKCLDLTGMPLEMMPRGVLSSFLNLEVLRMTDVNVKRVQQVEDNIVFGTGHAYLVEELECLQHLHELQISITSTSVLERFSASRKLKRITTVVDIKSLRGSQFLNISSLLNMTNLKTIQICRSKSLEEVRIHGPTVAARTCFHSLQRISIVRCSELREITWILLAPHLKFLLVWRCKKLEEIISQAKLSQVTAAGVGNLDPFSKLEEITLLNLPRLESIYWDNLPFSCLKSIEIRHCPKLKKLPLNSRSAMRQNIVIEATREWQSNLLWEDEATQNVFLPRFHILE